MLDNPVGAILLLLVLLAVTYRLLNVYVRVQPARDSDQATTPPEPIDEPIVPDTVTTNTLHEEEWEDWQRHAADGPQDVDLGVYTAPTVNEAPGIESIRVGQVIVALGDTASHVMTAFPPGVDAPRPEVDRGPGGFVRQVTRTYSVGPRTLVLKLERETPDGALLLTHIDLI